MPNEGYKERYLKWEAIQKKIREQLKPVTPYDPAKMRSRAPLGCVIGAIIFAAAVAWALYRAAVFGRIF